MQIVPHKSAFTRLAKLFALTAFCAGVLANLLGCAGPLEGNGSPVEPSYSSLRLGTGSYVLPAGGTLTLAPSGGQPPYRYYSSAGSCTVGVSSGLVTAGSIAEICAVGVADSGGSVVIASISVTAAATATKTYAWSAGSYGSCLSGAYAVTCGGGTRTRIVTCLDNSGATASNSLCSGTAPVATEACNQNACARPAGSYTLTCNAISLTGTVLTESCEGIAGGTYYTTTMTDWASCQPNSITNTNGVLTCTR